MNDGEVRGLEVILLKRAFTIVAPVLSPWESLNEFCCVLHERSQFRRFLGVRNTDTSSPFTSIPIRVSVGLNEAQDTLNSRLTVLNPIRHSPPIGL